MFSSGPKYEKLKTNLRLSINRMKLLQKKKTEEALKARKEIADYIKGGKCDRARIRVEHIIREDYMVEVLELLEMYCDLLLARFGVLQNMKEIDPALEEPVCTLIWCAPRLFSEVQELKPVAEQLTAKYGPKYAEEFCRREETCKANQKVRTKMGVAAPPAVLIEQYLVEIAKSYNLDYQPDQRVMAQAEANRSQALLLEFAGSNNLSAGIPAPISATQFNPIYDGPATSAGRVPPAIPQSGPYVAQPYPVAYPPPTFSDVPSLPPAYMEKPEQSFANEKPDISNTHGVYAYGGPIPPTQAASNSQYGKSNMDAAATAPPSQPSAPPIGFTLPDVPSDLSPPKDAHGNSPRNSDLDFDDLQRRFDELKRKK